MTDEEQQSLERWFERDIENRREYQVMLDVWDLAGDLEADADMSRILHARRWFDIMKSGLSLRLSVAAVAIAALFTTLLMSPQVIPGLSSDELTSYETDVGEQRQISLSDGSTIVLNTNTRLIVDFNEERRRIVMERGEAFFDIQRDPKRSLTIMVGGRSVSVLGTKFSVRWAGPEVVVAVAEGAVSVHSSSAVPQDSHMEPASSPKSEWRPTRPGADEIILGTGSVARFAEKLQTEITQEPRKVQELQTWRFGLSRFEDETLDRVISEINRYSKKRIVIEDGSIRELRVTGVFRFNDIDAVLKALQEVLPVRVIEEGNRSVLVGQPNMDQGSDMTAGEARRPWD